MHKEYMRQALNLAEKGRGNVSPNPLVGAVIVKEEKIIGQGYHPAYGEAHAEIYALKQAGNKAKDATLYVTLEPCCHYGKTPPCVDAIIKSGIKKVIVAMVDPNPLVSEQGIKKLRENGIEVEVGILEEEAKKLNEVFIKYITTKMPFVTLKIAMTLDGKIASYTGDAKWISGEASRRKVHQLRGEVEAIMVGSGTVLADNPMLTARGQEIFTQPRRIVLDSRLQIPLDAKLVQTAKEFSTIVITSQNADNKKIKALQAKKVEVWEMLLRDNHIDLFSVMKKLGEMRIDSVLLEGGSTIGFAAIQAGIVDKIQIYIAPKLLGGEKAKTALGGQGIAKIKDAVDVKNWSIQMMGKDILIEGYLKGEKECLQD